MTAGRVAVNGVIITELGRKIDPLSDEVCVDGTPINSRKAHTYLMLNKPAGYLTTMLDPQGRPTVRELVPSEAYPGLFPVGRLDFDTTGLLLFMTDGELAHAVLHPRHKVSKRYRALVDGILSEQEADMLREGILLSDGITQPALIEIGTVERKPLTARERLRLEEDKTFSPWQTTVWCTIGEGRKHQVKRMFTHVGHPVLKLEREAFGSLTLGNLKRGEWRHLRDDEVATLREKSGEGE
jgi:23S rRNA pseudouridine2605 synthase